MTALEEGPIDVVLAVEVVSAPGWRVALRSMVRGMSPDERLHVRVLIHDYASTSAIEDAWHLIAPDASGHVDCSVLVVEDDSDDPLYELCALLPRVSRCIFLRGDVLVVGDVGRMLRVELGGALVGGLAATEDEASDTQVVKAAGLVVDLDGFRSRGFDEPIVHVSRSTPVAWEHVRSDVEGSVVDLPSRIIIGASRLTGQAVDASAMTGEGSVRSSDQADSSRPTVVSYLEEEAPWVNTAVPFAGVWWQEAVSSGFRDELVADYLERAAERASRVQGQLRERLARARRAYRRLERDTARLPKGSDTPISTNESTRRADVPDADTTDLSDGLQESLRIAKSAYVAANRGSRAANEVLWGDIYRDTIQDSRWFKERAISPGRWALGYPALYVLYRLLDEAQPTSILELGLGQSTKLISQYAQWSGAAHTIVEHDPAWVETFSANYALPEASELKVLELETSSWGEDPEVLRYAGFAEAFAGRRFGLIVIDGPFGGDANVYARVDVVDLLPQLLAPRFAIMLDDHNRQAEANTAVKIVEALEEAGVNHQATTYTGVKAAWVGVSTDLGFFTTL